MRTRTTTTKGPDYRYFVGLMAGSGFGYATGDGRHESRRHVESSGTRRLRVAADRAGVRLLAELGADAVGADPLRVHHRHHGHPRDGADQCPNKRLQDGELRPRGVREGDLEVRRGQVPPVLLAGGGRRPHPPRRQFPETGLRKNCGPNHNQTCIDTIGAGPVLFGPGGGIMYDIRERASVVLQVNSVLASPRFHRPPRRQSRRRGRVLGLGRVGLVVRACVRIQVAVTVFVELGLSVTAGSGPCSNQCPSRIWRRSRAGRPSRASCGHHVSCVVQAEIAHLFGFEEADITVGRVGGLER